MGGEKLGACGGEEYVVVTGFFIKLGDTDARKSGGGGGWVWWWLGKDLQALRSPEEGWDPKPQWKCYLREDWRQGLHSK